MTTLRRLDCGRLTGSRSMFETGMDGTVVLPVSAWLIAHPKGTALFDTGMPRSFVDDDARVERMKSFMQVGFGADDTLAAQLHAAEQDPERVRFAIVSHLHFDHVGGLSMLDGATVVIQRSEWETAMAADEPPGALNTRRDFDLGHALRLVDGEHDLFGDGRVVCIPTPGHTVGHQSLRVTLDSGRRVVLTADCCYFARTLDSEVLPSFGHDLQQQRRSLGVLRRLRDDGAAIIPGHDADFIARTQTLLE